LKGGEKRKKMKEKNERRRRRRRMKSRKEVWERNTVKNRLRSVAGAISLTMVALVTLSVFAYAASAAQISVVPECQIVSMGEYITVNIYVDPEGNETYAAEYKLQFNNTLLNATSQVYGSFLSQDGVSTLEIVNKTNNTIGKIEYGETRQYVDYGVNTSGTLATITFEALADGSCELGLYDVILSTPPDPDPELIPTNVTNGSVRIGLCGDVNSDTSINVQDAIQVYYKVPGLNNWAADVTADVGDKTINVQDAIRIYYKSNLNCWCGA